MTTTLVTSMAQSVIGLADRDRVDPLDADGQRTLIDNAHALADMSAGQLAAVVRDMADRDACDPMTSEELGIFVDSARSLAQTHLAA